MTQYYLPGEYIIKEFEGDPSVFAGFDGHRWTIHGIRTFPPGWKPFWAQRQPDDMFSD